MDADVKRERLASALADAMAGGGPMQWGKDDCALWCANIVEAALGYDAAAKFRGRYATAEGAQGVLGPNGLPAALRTAARRHHWRRVDPAEAVVGDIGLMETGDSVSTVICRAPGWFVARSEAGWTALPASMVRLSWSVA